MGKADLNQLQCFMCTRSNDYLSAYQMLTLDLLQMTKAALIHGICE